MCCLVQPPTSLALRCVRRAQIPLGNFRPMTDQTPRTSECIRDGLLHPRGHMCSLLRPTHRELRPARCDKCSRLPLPTDERRRTKHGKLGQRTVEANNLHACQLPGRALRETRGAAITGERVGVSMHADAADSRYLLRVVPRACGELDDAAAQCHAEHDSGETGTLRALHERYVPIAQAARRCIVGMYAHRLAAVHLRRAAMIADVELAVQAARRLVRDQDQRPLRLVAVRFRAQP